MEKESKGSKLGYIYIILLYALIFQNFLQSYIKIFQYLDEILAVLGIIIMIYDFLKSRGKINRGNLIIIVCLTIISIIGFYSTIKYKYQEISYALIDWIAIIKFFTIYILSQTITKRYELMESSKFIYKGIKIAVIILLILTIMNYLFKLYPSEIRYGIMANRLFYEHPTYLAATCMALLANIIVFSKKINNIYIYICLLILVSTLRMKAIATLLVVFCIMIYVNKTNKKLSVYKLGILAVIAFVVAFPQIKYYFLGNGESARQVLTITSIKIANDYFPVGTGFGTFGSFVSGDNYSKVYETYGIEDTFGLQKGNAGFLTDNFWPMILGQFGYLGTFLYIICLLVIFIRIQKDFSKENKNIYIAKISCLVYLLISSIAEPAFVNPIAIPLALIMGLKIKNKN